MPLGDSPNDFRELCDLYYQPSDALFRRPASLEWRHEIDCLLKYSMWSMGLDYTVDGKILEQALLYSPGAAELLFTESGRCVGWMLDGKLKLHPKYANTPII
jgi:hypothetical protein